MRRIFFISFFVFSSIALFALDVDYRIGGRAGWIMPDGKVDKVVGQPDKWFGPIYGGDFSATFYPSWYSLRQWNGAGVGVGLTYWYMGHDMLGHAFAPYVYLDIPLVKLRHFHLGLRPGIGAAFMTKTYRNTVPEDHLFVDVINANQCIGSVSNLYFPEMVCFDFPIARGWTVGLSGGWYHVSNGSTRQPNSGYNVFAAELALSYRPALDNSCMCDNSVHSEWPRSRCLLGNKWWHIAAAVSAGGRQVYYRDQQSFIVGTAHVAAYWLAHPIFRLGLGVDAFYDGAYSLRDTYFQKTNLAAADSTGADCWRVGVSLQPEFVVGNFTAGLHIGAYVFDPVRELEPYKEAIEHKNGRLDKPIFYSYDLLKAGSAGYPDGWLYTELVLRYHLPYHIFVQAMMKSHLTKVEFVSLGLGFYY